MRLSICSTLLGRIKRGLSMDVRQRGTMAVSAFGGSGGIGDGRAK